MNSSKVTLLSPAFLCDLKILKEITYWSHVMNRPQGWHYDMDETWMLKNIEKAKIPKGAIILDAGAGLGIMQYVLASRGYNVVSLDFGKRLIPEESLGIFDITLEEQGSLEYKHSYQESMSFVGNSNSFKSRYKCFIEKLGRSNLILRLYYKIKRELSHFFYHTIEKMRDHGCYGKITFVRAAFHEIPFDENYFDAVISVSALEHADIELLDKNISEMCRVAKSGAPVLISTSAIGEEKDFFDGKTQGWCFCSQTLLRFSDNSTLEYSKYSDVEREILTSPLWLSRLDPYYYCNPNGHFFKKKMAGLPYLPIGIHLGK